MKCLMYLHILHSYLQFFLNENEKQHLCIFNCNYCVIHLFACIVEKRMYKKALRKEEPSRVSASRQV